MHYVYIHMYTHILEGAHLCNTHTPTLLIVMSSSKIDPCLFLVWSFPLRTGFCYAEQKALSVFQHCCFSLPPFQNKREFFLRYELLELELVKVQGPPYDGPFRSFKPQASPHSAFSN